jgi:hypothetical protein
MDELSQLDVIYQHDLDVVARNIAGEVILVPIRKQIKEMDYIYTLNPVATRMWQLFDGQRTLQAIQHQVCKEFEVDSNEAARDLLKLVEDLLEIGALDEVHSDQG